MASYAETIRKIRESWKAETGEDPGSAAGALLDQMSEAFFQVYHGADKEMAVRQDPLIAEYLQWQWTGDEGRELRAIVAKVKAEAVTAQT